MACGCLVICPPHQLKTVTQQVTNSLSTGIWIQAQRQGAERRLNMGQKFVFSASSEGHYQHQKALPGTTNHAWLPVSLLCSFNAWVHPLCLSFLSIALLSKKFSSFLITSLTLMSFVSSLALSCTKTDFFTKSFGTQSFCFAYILKQQLLVSWTGVAVWPPSEKWLLQKTKWSFWRIFGAMLNWICIVTIIPLQILLFLPPEGQQGHLVPCPIYISNSMCKPSPALSFLSSNSLCWLEKKKEKKKKIHYDKRPLTVCVCFCPPLHLQSISFCDASLSPKQVTCPLLYSGHICVYAGTFDGNDEC